MSKYDDIKCFFRLHQYEVHKEEPLLDVRDYNIGKVIINRCKVCGKIKYITIKTVEEHGIR